MIGPKQTTNEQMSNETKPTTSHEGSAKVRKNELKKTERRGVKKKIVG